MNPGFFCFLSLGLAHSVFCSQLWNHLSGDCAVQPLRPSDYPHRSFPSELSSITGILYSRIKIGFDASCLLITACLTFFFLGRLDGLGIGTILAALTMGKVIGLTGQALDRRFRFVIHHRRSGTVSQ